jgi:hypothetical protein
MEGTATLAQYDVDDFSRLYLANGNQLLAKVFGLGIGYPQRRGDGMVFSKKQTSDFNFTFYRYPKVDSFDLYRNYVAGVILGKLLPKRKIENNGHYVADKNVFTITNASNKIFAEE